MLIESLRGCSISDAGVLAAYREALEAELQACLSARQGFLYDLVRYHLGWVDQQGQPAEKVRYANFHALLAPACAEALSGEYALAMPAAAAVELAYNFTLVHGDVQAGRLTAGTRPSVWWVWGPAQAINAGDGLHALSRIAMLRLGNRGVPAEGVLASLELLDRACLAMCEGQFADLSFQDRLSVTRSEYDAMVAGKTAALTGCAAAMGALAAGADRPAQERFQLIGRMLGTAWQITQDVADFWGPAGDGMTASNVLNKKKGLPFIYALESSSAAAKRELGSIYLKRALEPADVARVAALLEAVDARTYAESQARLLVEPVLAAMETEGIPAERQKGLRALAEQALTIPD